MTKERSAAEDDHGRSEETRVSANGRPSLRLLSVGLAVRGREGGESFANIVSEATLVIFADGGLGAPPLTRDVMLPVTEWLTEWLASTVDRLLDVSDEIVDKGRGINSIVSEKPTRGLVSPSKEVLPRCFGGVNEFSLEIVPTALFPGLSEGDCKSDGANSMAGVVGALLPLFSLGGLMIFETS